MAWCKRVLLGKKILDYLGAIRPDEIDDLTFGDFPAIEALAFAVIEMREHVRRKDQAALIPDGDTYPKGFYDNYKVNRDVWG